jgi:hypothetical protein
MLEKQPNLIERRIPIEGELTEALRYASMKATGEKNHVMSGIFANLQTAFDFGVDNGWTEEDIIFFRLMEQKIKLLVDRKIKQVSLDSTDFIWVVDGSEYDNTKLIN